MAKKTAEAVVEPVVEEAEVQAEETVKKAEPKKEAKADEAVVVMNTVVPQSMNKEVIPMSDFHCCIGGVRYEFKKNQKQKVPADVERVLREADKIK